jgi:hypothetical protein
MRALSRRISPFIFSVLSVGVASLSTIDGVRAEFWYEDFTDENLSDSGIEWQFDRSNGTYSTSPDGLLSHSTRSCCGAIAKADWTVPRDGWSIRTQARQLQDHGFFGAGTMRDFPMNDATYNLIGARGTAAIGTLAADADERITTDLRSFEEDVIVQLDTLDGVMRMWAWKHDDQPMEDVAPLIEKDFDLLDGFPMIWNRSIDGPSSAAFRWIAISTEHMPVNMSVPLSDLIGDFSGNDILDITDIDLLGAAIRDHNVHPQFDVNRNGIVDPQDHAYWVSDLKHTWMGDANLDGEFNSGDLVEVFEAGKYETGEAVGWSQGDWNADGVFDSSDFTTAFQDGGYEMGARSAVAAVPEPSGVVLLALALACVGRIRKR